MGVRLYLIGMSGVGGGILEGTRARIASRNSQTTDTSMQYVDQTILGQFFVMRDPGGDDAQVQHIFALERVCRSGNLSSLACTGVCSRFAQRRTLNSSCA